MPVFISLFYMLRKDLKVDICGPEAKILATAKELGKSVSNTPCELVDPGSAKFLFIPDLTNNATGGVLVALLVLYVGSQLLSSILMSVTADKNQRIIMFALPFVFVFFIKGFPAGLLVYWITTNTWTVGQQYFIRRKTGQLPSWLGGSGDGPIPLNPAPATAGAAAVSGPVATKDAKIAGDGPKASPPPPPRQKKKRSGRRR
ncbi:unannotated protein [freshwater metagenome]|uniref:Unannotated protein n=1 Tax=freshwater metagenome TaxID=449393 RepID=A0A6J7CNN1_9ZZZZ